LPIDQARLRPHLRERAHLERQQARVLADAIADSDADVTSPRWKVPAGDDLDRLRGLPAIARDVRSVMRGTDPLQETIRRDERRRP
jgi:hypothetical protein